MKTIKKVIHLPSTVGGNPQCTSRHMNKIGLNSETWAIKQNYLGYPADKFIANFEDNLLVTELKKIAALKYVFNCDVAFFNFGTSLFTPFPSANLKKASVWMRLLYPFYYLYSTVMAVVEVMMLKILRKTIFIQYQGDDVRQGRYCLENFRISIADRVDTDYYNKLSDFNKKLRSKFYALFADKIYSLNPDLLYLLNDNAEFLPYSHISIKEWNPTYTQISARPIRIGHAPTNRDVKGTDIIIDCIERLKSVGYAVELVLVEGKSHADAKEIYKSIDILVDQLFAGWYGGLAVEAMALGKPVVCYIRNEDLLFIPGKMRDELPIIVADQSNIFDVISQILDMPRSDLHALAKRSRKFVETWHNPLLIAERIKSDIIKFSKY